jgi:hypothetical protein
MPSKLSFPASIPRPGQVAKAHKTQPIKQVMAPNNEVIRILGEMAWAWRSAITAEDQSKARRTPCEFRMSFNVRGFLTGFSLRGLAHFSSATSPAEFDISVSLFRGAAQTCNRDRQ